MSDNQVVRMKPDINNCIVPLHQYVQTVNDQKLIIFLYRAHFKRQIHFNGDEKILQHCNVGNVFRINGRQFKYDNGKWTEMIWEQSRS